MTKPKQYALSKRDIELAGGANIRTEFHGDKPVKALDLQFAGLMLEAAEFGELVQEQLVYRALYVKRAGSTLDEPLLKTVEWIPLDINLTGKVSLFSSLGEQEIDLGICELTRLKFRCRVGGLTEFKGMIQTKPTLDKRLAELVDRLGDNVQMAVNYEHEAEQQQLPMGAALVAAAAGKTDEPVVEGENPPKTEGLSEVGPKTREEIAKFEERRKARGTKGTPAGAH
jgi:hypothetical protein